jgi:hypothetical protein
VEGECRVCRGPVLAHFHMGKESTRKSWSWPALPGKGKGTKRQNYDGPFLELLAREGDLYMLEVQCLIASFVVCV